MVNGSVTEAVVAFFASRAKNLQKGVLELLTLGNVIVADGNDFAE